MDFGTEYDFDVLARHRREIREEIARNMIAAEAGKTAALNAPAGGRRIERPRGWLGRGWRRETTG